MQFASADGGAEEALLSIGGISRTYGQVRALADVSLDIRRGEVLCLLGENGAGKSTLCNLIFGLDKPDRGTMHLRSVPYEPRGPLDALRSGISMVHQHFSLVRTLNVLDNLLLARSSGVLDRKQVKAYVEETSNRYGLAVNPNANVGDLSVGERQRVEIIKCLLSKPELLVLDEPTAVLPPEEVASLLTIIRKMVDEGGHSVLLVTHKLAEIARVSDRIAVLRGGRLVQTSANDAQLDMSSIVRAMIGRDVGAIAAAATGSLAQGDTDFGPLERRAGPGTKMAFVADGLTMRLDSGALRLDTFTLVVAPGEIVGMAGVEGNGQTELGAIIAGLEEHYEGRFFVGDQELTHAEPGKITAAGVGVIPEDRHATGCFLPLSIAENLFLASIGTFSKFWLIDRATMHVEATRLIEKLDVRCSGPDATFGTLSGGNQQKVVLARELTLPDLKFILAAQPTRGLDVGAVEAVYQNLREASEQGVGILLISSELDELMAVAHRIVVIYRGRLVGELRRGAYDRERIGAMMAGHA